MTISPGAPETVGKPRHFDGQLAYVAGVILALLLLYAGFTLWLVNDPETSRGKDFLAFYTAAGIARHEGFAHIYDIDLERQYQEKVLGRALTGEQVLVYNHVPYVLPMLAVFVNDNYEASFIVWMAVLAGIILVSLGLLASLLPAQPRPWRWLLAGSMLFLPALNSISMGQDSGLILLGFSIFLWGMANRRENLAGLGLSLLTLRPQMALFFIIPLFFWSRRALRSYILGSMALASLSFLMIGPQGTQEYIRIMQLSVAGRGEVMNELAMFNLLGLALKLFPSLDPAWARQAAWGLFLFAGVAVALFSARSSLDPANKFGLALLVYLMTSPHLHYHEMILLLIPAAILARQLCRENPARLRPAATIAATISLAMFVIYYKPVYYAFPYLLAGLMAYGLIRRPDTPISSSTLEKSVG